MIKNQKSELWMLVSVMAVLIVGAIIFFRERILMPDMAEILFYTINNQSFFVTFSRFIDYFNESLLVALLPLDLSVKSLALVYSFNLIFFQLIFFLIVLFKYQDRKAGLAILLIIILGNYSFFYQNSEFNQSLTIDIWLISYFNFLKKRNNQFTVFQMFIFLCAIFFVVFCHPLAVVPLCFSLIFIATNYLKAEFKPTLYIILFFIVFSICNFIIWKVFFTSSYEQSRMNGFNSFSLFNSFNNTFSNSFFSNLINHSFLNLFLLSAFILSQLYFKKYVQLALIIISCLCYFLLISNTYSNEKFNYYYEHLSLPITYFIVIGFVFSENVFQKNNKLWLSLLLIVFVIRFSKINYFRLEIDKQMSWYQDKIEIANNAGYQKIVVDFNEYKNCIPNSFWATPTISLLQSTINNQSKSTLISLSSKYDLSKTEWNENDKIVLDFGVTNQNYLNKKYFNLGSKGYLKF